VIELVLQFRRAIVNGNQGRPLTASRDESTYPHCFASSPVKAVEPDHG